MAKQTNIPVMRITDSEGQQFWLDGHEQEEAEGSFGADITVERFYANPNAIPEAAGDYWLDRQQ